MLALVLSAFPSLTLPECGGGFIAAGLDLRKFELYDTWFDENSTVTLVQNGVYQGVDDIKEYMQFIQSGSPYISANGLLHDEKSVLNFDEEKRSCVFLSLAHNRFQMSEMGGNELFDAHRAEIPINAECDAERGKSTISRVSRSSFSSFLFLAVPLSLLLAAVSRALTINVWF